MLFVPYVFASSNGAPATNTPTPYVYVTKGTNLSWKYPLETFTYPVGPSKDTRPPSGREIQVAEIAMNPNLTTAQLIGEAAHEEGHNNFLLNCPPHVKYVAGSYTFGGCDIGGSLMESQDTSSPQQPTSPTICDVYWYDAYLTWH
jgi:hypothetical protein